MTNPWLYVGMMFSSFCWHTEDHWTYSINYLHLGEDKMWYGIPGDKAELFEQALQKAMPELFEHQPDLLHQLVTLVSPAFLLQRGVPVYRTSQRAGEFVITCPRAYHAGFNTGFNFAEAVNFAPGDWIPIGGECIKHYQRLQKPPVFCHEELLVSIARACSTEPLSVTVDAAQFASTALEDALREFNYKRGEFLRTQRIEPQQRALAAVPEDDRSCFKCGLICFLACVACSSCQKAACLEHAVDMCTCSINNRQLQYPYAQSALDPLVESLKTRAKALDRWVHTAEALADSNAQQPGLEAACKILGKAEPDWKLHPVVIKLKQAKAATIDQQQILKRVLRHATRKGCERPLFSEACQVLETAKTQSPWKFPEIGWLQTLVDETKELQKKAQDLLATDGVTVEQLDPIRERLASHGLILKDEKTTVESLRSVRAWKADCAKLLQQETILLEAISEKIRVGGFLPQDQCEDLLEQLIALEEECNQWQEEAKLIFGGLPDYESLRSLRDKAGVVKCARYQKVCRLLKQIEQWEAEADEVLAETPDRKFPPLETLKGLIAAKKTKVKLPRIPLIESRVKGAEAWLKRVKHAFLRRSTILPPRELRDALAPTGTPEAFEEIESLRAKHKEEESKPGAQFCICKNKTNGFMVACELCDGWFHGRCMHFTEKMGKTMPFVCGRCAKTRRPKIETVKNLIADAAKVTVDLPEVALLQNLIKETEEWIAADDPLKDGKYTEADVPKLEKHLMRGHMLELDTGNCRL